MTNLHRFRAPFVQICFAQDRKSTARCSASATLRPSSRRQEWGIYCVRARALQVVVTAVNKLT